MKQSAGSMPVEDNIKLHKRVLIIYLSFRDYDVLKQKKASLQKEKDRLAQENNYTRREVLYLYLV